MIRFATEEDAQALLAIYAYYIDTEITFEYELPTEAEFRKRIRTVLEEYPYLIYEDAGNILGYAYAHRHLERAAYQWNVELTVYLHPDVVSRGIISSLAACIHASATTPVVSQSVPSTSSIIAFIILDSSSFI